MTLAIALGVPTTAVQARDLTEAPLELARLHLVMVDLSGMPEDLPLGALQELRGLLALFDIAVTGELVPPGERRERPEVHVTFLPLDRSRGRSQATGGVACRSYARNPTVWAFPPRLAETLGVDLRDFGRWTGRERREFHRALALVILHELGHALAGATHRPSGLMSEGLSRRQLIDPRLTLDPDLQIALREGASRMAATQSSAE